MVKFPTIFYELQPPTLYFYFYLCEQKEDDGLQGPTDHRHLTSIIDDKISNVFS